MALKDLQARQSNVEVIAEVIEKGQVREFQKFGKAGRVCNAKVKDDSGTMSLTLWNEEIDKVEVGDKIHLTNGYVGEWQGEPQLSSGRFGKLEIEKGKAAPKKATPSAKAPVEEEAAEEEELE